MGALAEDGAGGLPLPGVDDPIPSGQYVRLILTGARERGWGFEEAWTSAINRIQPNGPTGNLPAVADLAVDRMLLEESRPRWQAAYENRDPHAIERTVCQLRTEQRLPDLHRFAERRIEPGYVERKAA